MGGPDPSQGWGQAGVGFFGRAGLALARAVTVARFEALWTVQTTEDIFVLYSYYGNKIHYTSSQDSLSFSLSWVPCTNITRMDNRHVENPVGPPYANGRD
ncbi:hypothetical protein CRG98_036665 [Punica granatum]|uniref:Uncharacterized protein n=1 Tax=Punica granatum TaxID=22663 RepID=A0A2I0IFU9_PUNGR|nr:hypothetical protein CRG98_036665 [Punica granatum]